MYYCSTGCKSKGMYFFHIYIYIYILNSGIFFFKVNEPDTSLYFLTVEKVAVSLPAKCLRNPTSGSALIGDYPVLLPGNATLIKCSFTFSAHYCSKRVKKKFPDGRSLPHTYVHKIHNCVKTFPLST